MDPGLKFDLILGNAIEELTSIASESIDFVFADPPYFLSNDGFSVQSGKTVSVNKGDWDRSKGFEQNVLFHEQWIAECLRTLKPNGTIAISGTYHSIFQCGYILQSLGCRVINDLVWFKPNGAPALAGRNFTASHETVIWASKSQQAKHFFDYQKSKNWVFPGDKILSPGKQMRSVWSIPTTPQREKLEGKHPTQKPLELLLRLVELCCPEGGTVLDPFCGSGTTGIAAAMLGRSFTGIDFNPDYINLTQKRLKALNETNA